MGACVGAGVVARATIVTKVAEEDDVWFPEIETPLESWKHSAQSFAVPTGIADVELPSGLVYQFL
jgi:hypothetical protein